MFSFSILIAPKKFLMSDSRLSTVLNLMKERVSLSRLVKQDVVLQKKGREFVGHCPFHNEKTGSFFVNDDKGTFYCFGCGASGDIIEYLMRKRGIQFMQAVEVLSEISGIKIPEKIDNNNDVFLSHEKILQKTLEFFKSSFPLNHEATAYCEKRGITRELIEKFSIGYAPKDGSLLLNHLKKSGFSVNDIINSGVFAERDGRIISRFRDRIIFPVFNKKGWPIAFGGRGIKKDAIPKYINSPETEIFQKRETLYNYNMALKNISKTVSFILVEGYMDVIMMSKFGYNTAIASMGTAFSSQHLAKLWKYSNNPIICLDGDDAGYNAMIKIALLALPYLQPGKSLRFCQIPGNDDPDSFLKTYGKSEMDKLLSSPENLIDFLWGYFFKEFNSLKEKTPENIVQWKKGVLEHIEEIQNADIKSLYRQNIRERIFALIGRNGRSKQFDKSASNFLTHVDKNEKNLLREAALLYILIMRPSVILNVIEELTVIEFLDEDFEQLRRFIAENPESVDFSGFNATLARIKKMVSKFFSCESMSDMEAVDFWQSIFDFGISKGRIEKDLKTAKDECESSLNTSTWDRLKALKLDFLGRRNKR